MAILSVYHSCCVDIINCKLTTSVLCSQLCHCTCFYQARNEERRGNIASARAKGNISLGLNVAAVVFTIMMWTVVAIPVAVTVNASRYTPQYCPTQYYCSTLSCYNSSNSSSCYRYYYYAYSSSLNNATYCYTYFSYYSYYYCAYYG